jgi:hypothetical protein
MRFRTLILPAVLAMCALPFGLQAQDASASEARYEAAIAWVNLVVVDHDFEAAADRAHEAVAAQMTAAVLEQAWAQLGPQLGALVSLEPQSQDMVQGLNLVVLTGVFAAGTFDVQVFMGDDHAVAGFFVRPPGA